MPVSLVDDRDRKLWFERPPRRIVSLVPSDTYSLLRLGAGERVVGRTSYCVEPEAEVASIPEVGGTKRSDVSKILALEPDVVVANKEENGRADVEAIEAAGIPVFVSMPATVAEGVAHLARLARLLGFERGQPGGERARELVRQGYASLSARWEGARPRVFVAIWNDPLMTANALTFLGSVVEAAGGENVFAERDRKFPLAADLGAAAEEPERGEGRDRRYPRVTFDEVRARGVDVALLPDEPYAFGPTDAEKFRAELGCRVELVSGKDLTWSGARAVEGMSRVRAWIHGAS